MLFPASTAGIYSKTGGDETSSFSRLRQWDRVHFKDAMAKEYPSTESWRLSELSEEQQAELLDRFAEAERGENLLPAKEAVAAAKRLSDEICGIVRPVRRSAAK